MSSRIQLIVSLLTDLQQRIQEHDPFNRAHLAEEEQDFVEKWEHLLTNSEPPSADFLFQAQELLSRFIRCYPNLVPLMRRELLYFIGGECLHYLGDEELELYQRVDEQLYELEQANHEVDVQAVIEENRPSSPDITVQ